MLLVAAVSGATSSSVLQFQDDAGICRFTKTGAKVVSDCAFESANGSSEARLTNIENYLAEQGSFNPSKKYTGKKSFDYTCKHGVYCQDRITPAPGQSGQSIKANSPEEVQAICDTVDECVAIDYRQDAK